MAKQYEASSIHSRGWYLQLLQLPATWQIPRGLNNTARIVLLVHVTGSSGNDSWGVSSYKLLPPKGYAIAWVNLPGNALGDSQISTEYVAYNIEQLRGTAPWARSQS
ncbi:hypothetical protein FIBSPDRAFT_882790 [Athelia psychrophila]|uniref:AB hydrolase-1 domain-containing protein n=1 Tax=Athelia psychrophila TaxID=1759441 RepID=A0A166UPI8_9AGAM|nr:hypothetical protein FIBSPDRAFT_882790 [Fibularhizoctonia sp. CBS 109695]